MINLDAVFSFEPSFNPFYEQSCSSYDLDEIVKELELNEDGE